MIVILKEIKNGIYKREIRIFKKKGLKFYSFIIINKILRKKIEILENGKFKKNKKKSKKKK